MWGGKGRRRTKFTGHQVAPGKHNVRVATTGNVGLALNVRSGTHGGKLNNERLARVDGRGVEDRANEGAARATHPFVARGREDGQLTTFKAHCTPLPTNRATKHKSCASLSKYVYVWQAASSAATAASTFFLWSFTLRLCLYLGRHKQPKKAWTN